MIGRRVAITGLGVVAPCGIGQENFWSGLLGQQFTGGKWTTITDWDPLPFFDNPKEARRADKVVPSALFGDDLDADSLDLVELVMALEEEFGVEVPEKEIEDIKTVGQAYDLIVGKLA